MKDVFINHLCSHSPTRLHLSVVNLMRLCCCNIMFVWNIVSWNHLQSINLNSVSLKLGRRTSQLPIRVIDCSDFPVWSYPQLRTLKNSPYRWSSIYIYISFFKQFVRCDVEYLSVLG